MKKFAAAVAAFFGAATLFCEGWRVCLGSFSVFTNASDFMFDLTMRGYSTAVEPSVVGGNLFYRVLLAEDFESVKSANAAVREAENELNLTDVWVFKPDLARKDLPEKLVGRARESEIQLSLKDERKISPEKPLQENRQNQEKNENFALADLGERVIEVEIVEEIAFEPGVDSVSSLPPLTAATEIPRAIDSVGFGKVEEIEEIEEAVEFSPPDPLPTTIPDSVRTLLGLFPVNSNFTLDSLHLYDLSNIRDSGLKIDTSEIEKIALPLENPVSDEKIRAASIGKYTDSTFGAELSVLMLEGVDFGIDSLFGENSAFSPIFEVEFDISGENFRGFVSDSKEGDAQAFFGVCEERGVFLALVPDDGGRDWINRFIVGQNAGPQEILKNDLLKKTLLSLPNEREALDRRFLDFSLTVSGEGIEREAGFENDEHWNARAEFDQEDTILRMAFFDVD